LYPFPLLLRLALRPKDALLTLKRTTSLVFIRGVASTDRIERSVARQLVWEGHAAWKNRCNDIEMLRIDYPLRGLSCQGMMQWGLNALAYTVPKLVMA
jgi:hypothetical protein